MVNVIVIEKCLINFMRDPMTYVAHKLCKKQKRKSAQKGIQVVNLIYPPFHKLWNLQDPHLLGGRGGRGNRRREGGRKREVRMS